ncbi:MAG TPA: cupredoxin domain-containing protein [Gammaproteobacteria bacterium]|nr:cupredoxin domain-containing protein [Gammaproteobacteria bacterium]
MFRSMLPRLGLICALGALLAAPAAFAADDTITYELVVKDHAFQPDKLVVPTGERIKLIIKNEDVTPMEFESYDLGREKVIVGKFTATLYLGPLEAGSYKFFDDFHRAATGTIIAKPKK